MRTKTPLLWLLFAVAIIALQGARPVGASHTTGAPPPPVASSTTGADSSTGTLGQVGTPYSGTYNTPALSYGPTLTEFTSTPSWGNSGGTLVTGNKHAVGTNANLSSNAGWADPYPSDPNSSFWSKGFLLRVNAVGQSADSVGNAPDTGPVVFNGVTYNFYDGPNPQESQKNNASDMSSTKNIRARSSLFSLNITTPGELGASASAGLVPISASTTAAGVFAPINPGSFVPIQLASTGGIPANTYSVIASCNKTWHKLDKFYNYFYHYIDPDGIAHTDYRYTIYLWTVKSSAPGVRNDMSTRKLLAGDSSVDTRKGYGDGITNDSTKQVGDPNADLTNYNFGTSVYHGGLFIGIMPWTTGDISGKARTQLYLPGGSMSQTKLADLSLFYLSAPSSAGGNETIDVYYPSSSDPNFSTAESTVTWATAWQTMAGGFSLAFPTTGGPPVNSWVNWPLDKSQTVLTSKLALTLHDETITGPVWRYFSSKENANGQGATYPTTDSQPRVWLLDQTGSSSW